MSVIILNSKRPSPHELRALPTTAPQSSFPRFYMSSSPARQPPRLKSNFFPICHSLRPCCPSSFDFHTIFQLSILGFIQLSANLALSPLPRSKSSISSHNTTSSSTLQPIQRPRNHLEFHPEPRPLYFIHLSTSNYTN